MSKLYAPGEVARQLGISPTTLRRWTKAFSAHLSPLAREPKKQGLHYPYYDENDLRFLRQIQQWRRNGYSYADLQQTLSGKTQPSLLALNEPPEAEAIGELAPSTPAPPAVAMLQEALQSVHNGQQLLLNGQQHSRQILGVVVQDNFNLKAENGKIRKRLLELERELHRDQRQQQQRQEMLEARLIALESLVQVLQQQLRTLLEKKRGSWLRR